MTTLILHASPPWTVSYEEDRRFRRILLQMLLICLAIGVITPYIRIPQPVPDLAVELPPRRVRLLTEPVTQQPAPVTVSPEAEAPAEPQPVAVTPPRVPRVTPRQKASRTGVLAMSDALAELRSKTPKVEVNQQQNAAIHHGPAETAQPSLLTANLTRGSQGIAGGVAPQLVLGTVGLPEREGSGQGTGNRGAELAARSGSAAISSGPVRSKEEIQEILDRNKGAMYRLYNRALQKEGGLQGKLVMSLTIAPAGEVTRCVILSSDLDAATLEEQLVTLVRRIDFGNKPGAPAVTTRVPIEFFPR